MATIPEPIWALPSSISPPEVLGLEPLHHAGQHLMSAKHTDSARAAACGSTCLPSPARTAERDLLAGFGELPFQHAAFVENRLESLNHFVRLGA